MEEKRSFLSGVSEFFRKRMVALKRKPHQIAMVVLAIAFVYFTLNLTNFSNTTARVNRAGMGLSQFVMVLFSTLSLVSFMNAFPHRKGVRIPMLVLMFLMVAAVFAAGVIYENQINGYIADGMDVSKYPSILTAKHVLHVHRIILIAAAALTALLPVYTPLLRKINTNVEIAGNGEMNAIDISGEDA